MDESASSVAAELPAEDDLNASRRGGPGTANEPALYPCDARGTCIVDGDSHAIAWEAVGPTHCRFEVDAVVAPQRGVKVRVGLPGAPFVNGLAWVAGRVVSLRNGSPGRMRVEVELRRRESLIPSIYDRLVQRWAANLTPRVMGASG